MAEQRLDATARSRALRRAANELPSGRYKQILEEERAKLGLEPVDETKPGPKRKVNKTGSRSEQLIEQYLLFLRGRGPEPSVPEDRREEITALFELVAALADRDPSPPELKDDPVAIRLGLANDRKAKS